MYQVFENDKPAQYPEQDIHPSWDNSKFETKLEAKAYMIKYLGDFCPQDVSPECLPDKYDLYGSIIEVKEV